MARRARWIRLGRVEARELRAACAGLCAMQAREAAPIVLWACTESPLYGFAQEDERGYRFVVIAPRHVAPGLAARWVAWALSPVVAAYRDFGVRAYLDGSDVCLHGRRIGGGCGEMVGHWVAITAGLDLAASHAETSVSAPGFRAWLREGLGLALTQCASEGDAPAERAFEAALRARIEAQHGWQFETAWPNAAERRAIDAARASSSGLDADPGPHAAGAALSQADFAD